jgi:flavin reductase (DIM6/NTAB) family NADH-FMN oxidoreductase RutF
VSSGHLKSHLEDREIRNAFGTYPTGVTVVTCVCKDGTAVGVTANSFVSLSLSPPLVSVALHAASRYLRSILDTGAFAINVLRADQHGLSNLFARPSTCSWKDVRFRIAPSGHLVLEGVAASFLCHLSAQHLVGDHLLLIGEVEHFTHDACVEPLAFLRGRYGRVQLAAHPLPAELLDHWSTSAIGWG